MKNNIFIKSKILLLLFVGFLVTQAGAQSLSEVLRQKAAAYTYANKTDSALYFARQLVTNFPTTENCLLLGSIYELRKDQTTADLNYQKALSLAGADAYRVYADLARVAYRRGQKDRAILYSRQSLALNDAQPELHYFAGTLFRDGGSGDSAAYHFGHAYIQNPADTAFAHTMFAVAYDSGNLEQAALIAADGAARDTADRRFHKALVSVLLELDRYADALPLVEHPSGPEAYLDYFALATCRLHLNDTTGAELALKEAIALAPKPEATYYNQLTQIYTARGQRPLLLEWKQRGAQAGLPGYADWLASYPEKVDSITSLYARLNETNAATVLRDLGNLYYSLEDYRSCLKVLNDYATAGGTPTAEAYALMAAAALGLNQNTEAKTDIEKALALAPGNADYTALQNIIRWRLHDYEGIIGDAQTLRTKEARRAAATAPDEYFLFKAYQALGRKKEAAQAHRAYRQP